jgi:hypothetical protein
MAVNDGTGQGWPFHNHAMEVRGTQSVRGPSRQSIVYPRAKFTFVVEFFINPRALDPTRMQTNLSEFLNSGRIFAPLRSIGHPQTSINVEKIRSYNKNVLIPTRVDYAPSSMGFHDDNSSIAMALWREYRAYYQHEGTLGTTSVKNGTPERSSVDEFRSGNQLTGKDVRSEQSSRPSLGMTLRANDGRHFFDAIRVYDLGADPDSVNVYTYINPMITSMSHDGLDYEDRSGQVGIDFSFEYEGYYHLTGLNNSNFHDAIHLQLNTSPKTTSYKVGGHATMDQVSRPDSFNPTRGTGFNVDNTIGLIDSLEGIIGTVGDGISFANVASIAKQATSIADTVVGGNVGITPTDIAAILQRTIKLF